MKQPTISIVIPVYNTEKYLSACLESIINQTFNDLEIICVNDGSNDSSLSILDSYAKQDTRVRIVTQSNQGVSAARNTGLLHVSGKYVMFIDSDDWLDITTCEYMLSLADQYNADAVMCSYCKEYESHTTISHIFPQHLLVYEKADVQSNITRRLFGPISTELSRPQDMDLPVSAGMQLFVADYAKSIQFTDLSIIGSFEDGLYQIEYYQKCKCFVYADEPLYHYRKTNAASITTIYKPKLFEQWQVLFGIMYAIIEDKKLDNSYVLALTNRIAFSMVSLGLNEIAAANKTFRDKADRLLHFLSTERYEKALAQLKLERLPLHWKVFFYLCKYKWTKELISYLKLIEFLRKRV